MITDPLVIMFKQDESIICHLHPLAGYDHTHYGFLICDLVRHVTAAFKVEEDDVWAWVDKERYQHMTEIRQPS